METQKTEEELIGTLVKLRKCDSELGQKIDNLVQYHDGDFHKALEIKYENTNDSERLFKAKMSVNPDRIIALAESLKKLQDEYKTAHKALREFEGKNPTIVEKYGRASYIY